MYRNNRLKFVFDTKNIIINGENDVTITLDNCRANVKVENGSMASGGGASFTIYGMSGELISALATIGTDGYNQGDGVRVGVEIYANDSLVFSGRVNYVYADMNEVPNVGINFRAAGSVNLSRSIAPDFSFKGTMELSDILEGICKQSNFTFVNGGVTGTQTNGYYSGTPLKQIRDLCNGGILRFSVNGRTVTAWDKYTGKISKIRAQVSPENGLIGYPVYTSSGLTIQTQFSPYIAIGEQLRLETSLPGASGDYVANMVTHFLTSWEKNGAWHTLATITPFREKKNE